MIIFARKSSIKKTTVKAGAGSLQLRKCPTITSPVIEVQVPIWINHNSRATIRLAKLRSSMVIFVGPLVRDLDRPWRGSKTQIKQPPAGACHILDDMLIGVWMVMGMNPEPSSWWKTEEAPQRRAPRVPFVGWTLLSFQGHFLSLFGQIHMCKLIDTYLKMQSLLRSSYPSKCEW